MVGHTMKKIYPIIIGLILLVFSLCGCGQNTNSVIEEYGDNILIVDSDSITNNAFQNLCEVTQTTPIKSTKRFKFIVLSETNATSPTTIKDIQKKAIEGYTIIYPQTNKEKLNNFLKSFPIKLDSNSYNVNGCVLKRDLNTTTHTYYIQAIPSYSNAVQSSIDFIKSNIESTVTLDLTYKDNLEFLGVYISKAIFSDSDFKEINPFSQNIVFDEFDTFSSNADKKFAFSLDHEKGFITYSVHYEVSKAEMEFFYAYIIVKDFYGNTSAIPLKNSAFTHSGITHTLTERIPVCSGVRAFADIPEFLQITFTFV